MEEYEIIEQIYGSIEKDGLMQTIGKVFGVGTVIELPFGKKACETETVNLPLSVRSINCLMRAGLFFVGKVIDVMQKDKLLEIRNLGKNSKAEIHVCMYEFGYNSLDDRGRKKFAKRLYELNKDKYDTERKIG